MSPVVFPPLPTPVRAPGPDLLATVAHETRTPLTAVIGMTDLLRQMALPADAAALVETIHESGEQLLALMNDLLDAACLDAGRFELEQVDFLLRDVVESAVETAAATGGVDGPSVEAVLDPSLPDVVRGDPRRLGQALGNLLGNAVRFTARGFVSLRVTPVARTPRALTCRIEVQDSGIGIDPQAVPRLFEPFAQADAATGRRYGGTGLGLSIAARIVAAMGSRIDVDSRPGLGSRFLFDVELGCGRPLPSHVHDLPASDGLRVVLGTSDTLLADVVRAQAARLGAPVIVIDSARAVTRLAGASRAVLLLDSQLDDAEAVHAAAARAGVAVVELVPARRVGPAHARVHLRRPVRLRAFARALAMIQPNGTDGAGERGVPSRPPDRRVLVVEDDHASQQLVSHVLAREGVGVDLVTSGEAACAAIASRVYDLVLMDCQLPGMDGAAATRAIRSVTAGSVLPIIGFTAFAGPEARAACLAAGMSDVLVKPARPSMLADTVRRWLHAASIGTTDARAHESHDHPGGSLLEPAMVVELTRLGLLVDMARAATRDVPSHLVDLVAAASLGEGEKLGLVAHRLTTLLGNVGWTRASAIASRVETACGDGDDGEARRQVRALERELREGLPELRRLAAHAEGATGTCAH
jgi:CheY-like chemotaxis protein/HPt (histidine-containing phosphotransfer) domain-containing protein